MDHSRKILTSFSSSDDEENQYKSDSENEGDDNKSHVNFNWTDSGKLIVLKSLLDGWLRRDVEKSNHPSPPNKILLFSQSIKMLNILGEFLRGLGLKYERMDGSVPAFTRHKVISEFEKSVDTNVFLLSTKVGGTGLNLVILEL